jgi:hypothetical protein
MSLGATDSWFKCLNRRCRHPRRWLNPGSNSAGEKKWIAFLRPVGCVTRMCARMAELQKSATMEWVGPCCRMACQRGFAGRDACIPAETRKRSQAAADRIGHRINLWSVAWVGAGVRRTG